MTTKQLLSEEIKEYPFIKDRAAFMADLISNTHLYVESPQKLQTINYFKKIKIFGSDKMFYLIEYDYHDGCNAGFPRKSQLLFDSRGKLKNVLSEVWIDTITILTGETPFLMSMSRTARGNGGHFIYKMQHESLEKVYGRNDEPTVQTYASGDWLFVNIPYELKHRIADDNNDGYNDVIFYGKIRYSTYDPGHDDDKIVRVKFIFLYDKQSGHFKAKENYRKKYEVIYGKD